MKYALLFAALGLFFGGCHREKPEEIWPTALAWFHGQDGDVLLFRNDTLGVRRVRITRKEEVRSDPSKSADNPYRWLSLHYAEEVNIRHSLGIEAGRLGVVSFQRGDSAYAFYANIRAYRQGSDTRDSVQQAYVMQMAFITDSTLWGRHYPTLLHGKLHPAFSARISPLTEFFYSKTDGLVAYRTEDKRMWRREF